MIHTENNVVHMRKRLKIPLTRVRREMVMTPWGDSASLRERRLQPVRGASQAEVEKNQRERLFAALVASVAERGYAATTVANLVELSGVSSRSFYDQFGDMQGCMRAMVQELLGAARRALEDDGEADGLQAEASRRYRTFAGLVTSQPAASKVLLSEVFAAGPEALDPVERAIVQYERGLRGRLERTPSGEGAPNQIVTAVTGGILEIARRRLRLGRADELSDLGDQIIPAVLGYRPPPEPLRLGTRQRWESTETLEAADHSERAIRAFATLCAEQGYQKTSIDEVVKLASMSSRTFYGHFSGKEDLMGAAIDSACAQMVAASMPAFSRRRDWPAGIRAGIGAMLGFLASRPALARLLLVETYVAGDFAIERRDRGAAPLGMLLENNTTEWQMMPAAVYELIAGGVTRLMYREVLRGGPQALPGLAPILTYFTLAPFLGPEEACEVANGGDGRRPEGSGRTWIPAFGAGVIPLQLPVRGPASLALSTLLEHTAVREEEGMTAAEIAAEVGKETEVVSDQLSELLAADVIEVVQPSDEDSSPGEPRYRSVSAVHPTHVVTRQQTAQMSLAERGELSALLVGLIDDDVKASLQSSKFDQRSERFLTRTPMKVDEQGWREIAVLHEQLLNAGIEVAARSAARLERSDEQPIEMRSVQMLFEMPPKTADKGRGVT